MTAILTHMSAVLTFVLAGLGSVVSEIIANPLLLLFVALGVAGMIVYWVKSLIHV